MRNRDFMCDGFFALIATGQCCCSRSWSLSHLSSRAGRPHLFSSGWCRGPVPVARLIEIFGPEPGAGGPAFLPHICELTRV